VVAAAVRMVHSPRDRTRIRTQAIRRQGQAVVAAVTEAGLPQEDTAWALQARAPAPAAVAPEAAGRVRQRIESVLDFLLLNAAEIASYGLASR
jgi:hypothetical protein